MEAIQPLLNIMSITDMYFGIYVAIISVYIPFEMAKTECDGKILKLKIDIRSVFLAYGYCGKYSKQGGQITSLLKTHFIFKWCNIHHSSNVEYLGKLVELSLKLLVCWSDWMLNIATLLFFSCTMLIGQRFEEGPIPKYSIFNFYNRPFPVNIYCKF